ncbi:hypothetical protein [Streptomyces sp. NBC_01768]|nr:hypothetical protein [Streptomyces sp. NBC_01768]WSC32280.1 hypothetical protein OG902_39475 [Streptomyces sp. NBC_01768]
MARTARAFGELIQVVLELARHQDCLTADSEEKARLMDIPRRRSPHGSL